MNPKLEDLNEEQREKLADAALFLGMKDQEVLDRLPEIVDAICKAFEPMLNAFLELGDNITEWWENIPLETKDALKQAIAEHEAAEPDKRPGAIARVSLCSPVEATEYLIQGFTPTQIVRGFNHGFNTASRDLPPPGWAEIESYAAMGFNIEKR